jgi:hypothetical protein
MKTTMTQWIESEDCVQVQSGSSDGYDTFIYRSRKTGRFVLEVVYIHDGRATYYVCPTIDDARSACSSGYIPGDGPGKATYVSRPGALRELRAR